MASPTQTQSQLYEVLALLKRRLWHILLPAVLTASLGVMAAALLPRKYEAHTQIELVVIPFSLVSAGLDPGMLKSDVFAADNHIRSFERLRRVIADDLEWEEFQRLPPDSQHEYLKRVIANLRVQPKTLQNTNATFLDLYYSDTDPQRAAEFLNAVRDTYTHEKLDHLRAAAEKARDTQMKMLDGLNTLYDQYSDVARKLRAENTVSPTQQAPGGGRTRDEDPVYERWKAAQNDLNRQDLALKRAKAERATLAEQMKAEPEIVPDTLVTAGIDLSQELDRIDKLIAAELLSQAGLKPAHRRHKLAQEEIESLNKQKDLLLGRSSDPTAAVRMVKNPKRQALLDQLEDKDTEIAGLETTVEELTGEVQKLQLDNAYRQEIYTRLSTIDFRIRQVEGQIDTASAALTKHRSLVEALREKEFLPFEVTELALPPRRPSSPNVPLVIALAVACGLALGLAWALLAEFGRNAFRGPADLGRALPVPVLGAVNAIVTTPQRNALALRRALIGSSTLILSGAILWITWAYQEYPRMLGSGLTRFLDELRSQFR